MRYVGTICAVALILSLAVAADAAVLDGGFESPPAGYEFGYHIFNPNSVAPDQSPWTFVGSAGVARPGWQRLSYSVPEGEQVGFLGGGDGGLGGGAYSSGIRQELTGLTPSAPYRVQFYAACPDNERSIDPDLVRVTIDGVDVGQVLPGPSFELYSTDVFVAPSSGSAVLTFVGEDPTPTFGQALTFLDGVTVSRVPEPANFAAVVCAGLMARRWRRGDWSR
jgi:hypothetical protein